MNQLSPSPANALGFRVKTSKYGGDVNQIVSNFAQKKTGSRPTKADESWWKQYAKEEQELRMQAYEKEEDYLHQNHQLPLPSAEEIGSQNWLAHELGEDIFCRHCGNTLCMQYNTVRSGWMVHCTYCGMNGPVENDKDEALTGFAGIIMQ